MSENLVQKEPRVISADLPAVGPIAFGMWRYTTEKIEEATELLETAVELGMNLIDNADVYGFDWGGKGFGACEELLGKVIATSPKLLAKSLRKMAWSGCLRRKRQERTPIRTQCIFSSILKN